MAPRQRLPGWLANDRLAPRRSDAAPREAHHRHRHRAVGASVRARPGPPADHPSAGHAALGSPPHLQRPLGSPGLDARPLRRRGPARRRGLRDDARGAPMRFSYCMLPDYSFDDMIDMIKTADDLGFYACYSVDE